MAQRSPPVGLRRKQQNAEMKNNQDKIYKIFPGTGNFKNYWRPLYQQRTTCGGFESYDKKKMFCHRMRNTST